MYFIGAEDAKRIERLGDARTVLSATHNVVGFLYKNRKSYPLDLPICEGGKMKAFLQMLHEILVYE